jgi:hypothetical protein
MREAEVLRDAIAKATKNGFRISKAKIAIPYLFSEEFAKAFWGVYPLYALDIQTYEGKQIKKCGLESWQYHLMMMSVNDPIRYVEKFL